MNLHLARMQARVRQWSLGMTGASSHSMTWSICASQHLFLSMAILQSLLNCSPTLVGLASGLSFTSTRLMMTGSMPSSPVGVWQRLRPITSPINWSFSPLCGLWLRNFMSIFMGSTFDVYTDNNPLMYILTMAKLDATSHFWVASLDNYNFQLFYRARKTNIHADALWRVYWPRCVPDTLDTHYWGTAVVVPAMQEAALESPIEAYSCNMHVHDLVGDGLQVTCMTTNNWHQAQWADPVLGLVIVRMQDGTLGLCPFKLTDQLELLAVPLGTQPPQAEHGVSCIEGSLQRNLRRPNFNWSCWLHIRRPLWDSAMMRLAT